MTITSLRKARHGANTTIHRESRAGTGVRCLYSDRLGGSKALLESQVAGQEGLQRGTLDHTPEAVEVWIMELQVRFGGRPLYPPPTPVPCWIRLPTWWRPGDRLCGERHTRSAPDRRSRLWF